MPTDAPKSKLSPPSERAVLRRLFLTLFLRGHSARGLQKSSAPKSVGRKLALTLLIYALFGAVTLVLRSQPVLIVSSYLHGLTLMFLGMFVASSAGEVLFNREEADILMHRPIDPRALLWAKVWVLVEVSLWLAGALNLVGTIGAATSASGNWRFVPVHAASTALLALFCTSCVVLLYQLCLRWFGRERLDGLMTTAQVVLSIAAVMSGQFLPEIMRHFEHGGGQSSVQWWTWILPPVWFAGIDDALAGSGSLASCGLATIGCAMTATCLWLAFGKLAAGFEAGLQALNENTGRRRRSTGRLRLLDRLIALPILRWWLRDPRERAAFLLTAAYITRDRDTKLRLYPAIAPFLALPVVFMVRDATTARGGLGDGFGAVFSSAYVGVVPMMALSLLQFSQHWRAADVFRTAPLPGPAVICHGARKAVLVLLTVPLVIVFTACAWLIRRDADVLLLLLPGIIILPLVALIPHLGGKGVPLSQPIEQAKSATRGLLMMGTMIATMLLSGIALAARHAGLLLPLLAVEFIGVAALQLLITHVLNAVVWSSTD